MNDDLFTLMDETHRARTACLTEGERDGAHRARRRRSARRSGGVARRGTTP